MDEQEQIAAEYDRLTRLSLENANALESNLRSIEEYTIRLEKLNAQLKNVKEKANNRRPGKKK